MKRFIFFAAIFAFNTTAFSTDVGVGKIVFGSGTPSVKNIGGFERAEIVDNAGVENNILHAPQYMPNHPTAATIWPRSIEVTCTKEINGSLNCGGYNWNTTMGRGEYLFITPKIVEPVKPIIVTVIKEVPVTVIKEVPVTVIKEVPGPVREVLVEVPVKQKRE